MYHLLLLCTIINTNNAEDPFNTDSGNHIDYLEQKFYDLYFFRNDTLLEEIKLTNNPNAIMQQNLSTTDDVPELRIDLNWDFKFYGHLHNWILISPNGFLSTHPTSCWSFCNWWYEEQNYRRYIAPMMADFNPSSSDDSHVLYYIDDDEQSLNVQWHNVTLWQPSSSDPFGYKYDFQVKLKSDGTIHFYYFNVPKAPNNIQVPLYLQNYSLHIGLEDAAYKHDSDGLYYIHPYSPVDINVSHALNGHVVVFKPKETCIDQISCSDCQGLATDPGSSLECGWCPELGLCSDGMGREVYEYTSHEYCTEDEMVDTLASETCTDYLTETRYCKENDHVLARYPSEMVQDGNSRLYSGVIIGLNDDSNTYSIHYDDSAKSDSNVQYSYIHPCSTVSYDYSSYDLPPRCVPHCASIRNKRKSKSEALITSICIAVAVLVVICACVQLFLYRSRRRQRNEDNVPMVNPWVDQSSVRGHELGDDDDISLKFPSLPTSGMNSENDMNDNMNRVSHPIISPAPKLRSSNNGNIELAEVVDVQIEEFGEVQLESEGIAASLNAKDVNGNKKGWDMTPLS